MTEVGAGAGFSAALAAGFSFGVSTGGCREVTGLKGAACNTVSSFLDSKNVKSGLSSLGETLLSFFAEVAAGVLAASFWACARPTNIPRMKKIEHSTTMPVKTRRVNV